MKEIGGYLELEHYSGKMLYDEGIKLDCGRNCLAYLILAKKIRKLAIPYFMCDSDFILCRQYGVEMQFYHVGQDLRISGDLALDDQTWLYVINYYGQITSDEILVLKEKYGRIIVDNAQAYFCPPIPGIDTLYTCRKFFGVPDGGILFTDTLLDEAPPRSQSHRNMMHLLGRFEMGGSAFYRESAENNDRFEGSSLKSMSALTENLLKSIDYSHVKEKRTRNFRYLHEQLGHLNQLQLRQAQGAFAYPLMLPEGAEIKRYLVAHKIYVPTLWPNVLQENSPDSLEYRLSADILPLPCDQRYGEEEMQYICNLIQEALDSREVGSEIIVGVK